MDREFKIALGIVAGLLAVATLLLQILAHIPFGSADWLRGFLPFFFLLTPYVLLSTQFCTENLRRVVGGNFLFRTLLPFYILVVYAVSAVMNGNIHADMFIKLGLWLFLPAVLLSVPVLEGHPLYLKEFAAALILWLPIEFGKLPGFDIIFREDIQIPALAFAAPVLGLYLFAVLRNLPDIGYHFRWKPPDFIPVLISLGCLALLLIPLGTHLGFIRFSSFDTSAADLLKLLFGIYFLVALPEELLFRGIIQNLLSKICAPLPQARMISLALAASIFGLSHYNNFNPPDWRYVILATIAGLFYGWTYNKTGKTTISALVHTGVNVLWAVLFKETGG